MDLSISLDQFTQYYLTKTNSILFPEINLEFYKNVMLYLPEDSDNVKEMVKYVSSLCFYMPSSFDLDKNILFEPIEKDTLVGPLNKQYLMDETGLDYIDYSQLKPYSDSEYNLSKLEITKVWNYLLDSDYDTLIYVNTMLIKYIKAFRCPFITADEMADGSDMTIILPNNIIQHIIKPYNSPSIDHGTVMRIVINMDKVHEISESAAFYYAIMSAAEYLNGSDHNPDEVKYHLISKVFPKINSINVISMNDHTAKVWENFTNNNDDLP